MLYQRLSDHQRLTPKKNGNQHTQYTLTGDNTCEVRRQPRPQSLSSPRLPPPIHVATHTGPHLSR